MPELIPLEELLTLSYSTHSFLPSGWVISILLNNQLIFIFPLSILSILTFYLGGRSFKYSYYSESPHGNKKEIKNKKIIKLPLNKSLNAVLNKEFKYYLRDPNMKISLVSSMAFVLIFGLQPYFQSGEITLFNLKYLGVFAGFFFSFSFFNFLGYEREGLFKLLSSPIERKNIFLGKNFLLILVFLLYITIIDIFLVLLINAPINSEYFLISISSLLITLSVTNYTGVRFAKKMPRELRGGRNASFIGILITFLLSGTLFIPIALHLIGQNLPLPVITPSIYLVLIYSIIVYLIALKFSISYLRKNETILLEKFQD